MQELLEAIKQDSLVKIKKLLTSKTYDLNSYVQIGLEYDLDEYDEIPLLFFLIQSGASIEAIELLMQHGLDITKTNREGISAIDIAIKYKRFDVLELCKKHNMDFSTTKRKSGLTPLMLAASFNDIEMMKFLIKNGANYEDKDKFGMSALDYAAKMGQKKAVEFLENLQG
jgi:ankyrin repeat protein